MYEPSPGPVYSTADVARLLGQPPWRIARLFQDGTLPEVARVAGRRVLREADVERVRQALAGHQEQRT
jgi:hypothetical protein